MMTLEEAIDIIENKIQIDVRLCTKERRKNMKTRANCAFGGCGKVDSKGAMCKHCGFDATQNRIRMAIIKQRGLSRDPATGLCKLVFRGQYK